MTYERKKRETRNADDFRQQRDLKIERKNLDAGEGAT